MADKTMEELFDEKIHVALNLIRTNLQGPEAVNFTQAVQNLAHAKEILCPGKTPQKKQVTGSN